MKVLYTLGHSNHSLEKFLELLYKYRITVVGDVRSYPYSRHYTHFNYAYLQRELPKNNLMYLFWGKELGGRPDDPTCYDHKGKVQYTRLTHTPLFQVGLNQLKQMMESYRVVLMCAEKDPLDCHRCILICRQLREFMIQHILDNGNIETQPETERRLLSKYDLLQQPSLFNWDLEKAYDLQSQEIAYSKKLMVREEETNYGKYSNIYSHFEV
jgi:uncharacterized protein (DUF488 family)